MLALTRKPGSTYSHLPTIPQFGWMSIPASVLAKILSLYENVTLQWAKCSKCHRFAQEKYRCNILTGFKPTFCQKCPVVSIAKDWVSFHHNPQRKESSPTFRIWMWTRRRWVRMWRVPLVVEKLKSPDPRAHPVSPHTRVRWGRVSTHFSLRGIPSWRRVKSRSCYMTSCRAKEYQGSPLSPSSFRRHPPESWEAMIQGKGANAISIIFHNFIKKKWIRERWDEPSGCTRDNLYWKFQIVAKFAELNP